MLIFVTMLQRRLNDAVYQNLLCSMCVFVCVIVICEGMWV